MPEARSFVEADLPKQADSAFRSVVTDLEVRHHDADSIGWREPLGRSRAEDGRVQKVAGDVVALVMTPRRVLDATAVAGMAEDLVELTL